MLTASVFLIVYALGLVLTFFKHPVFGLYTYLWAFYLAPGTTWLSKLVPDIRYLFIAALATAVALVFSTPTLESRVQRIPWYKTRPGILITIGILWMVIQSLWAISPERHYEGIFVFLKHGTAFLIIYTLLRTRIQLESFLFVHIGGCVWLGLRGLSSGGGRIENLGGAINNANLLGAHVATAVIFLALFLIGSTRLRKLSCFFAAPFVLNVVILTQSRGAFLGLVVGSAAAFFMIPRSYRGAYLGLGSLGFVLLLMLASEQFIYRMGTIVDAFSDQPSEEIETRGGEDKDKRVAIAIGGWQMALDYPMGTGFRGTSVLSKRYMPEFVLPRNGAGRGAHNTVVGTLTEFGFPGVLIMFGFVYWAFSTLTRLKSLDNIGFPSELGLLRAAIAGCCTSMLVSGQFSNFYQAEMMFWLLAMLACLDHLGREWFLNNSSKYEKSPVAIEH